VWTFQAELPEDRKDISSINCLGKAGTQKLVVIHWKSFRFVITENLEAA
jgi:hypothetical protein